MYLNPEVFREYDIRGVAERDLGPEFAKRLAWALSQRLKPNSTVVVGRDCRLTNDMLTEPLIEGFLESGISVISLTVGPTPMTSFGLYHLNVDGSVMVTGSHNPAEYNGFKMVLGRDTLHGDAIRSLLPVVEAGVPPKSPTRGTRTEKDLLKDYVSHIVGGIKISKPKKVVLDAGNGTAAVAAPMIFKALGCDVTELYCTMDGRFPNHHPDPTVPENLKVLRKTVLEKGADFGVAFDGDADRIGVVDETGRFLYGDELMVILARAVLKKNPGATVISEVKSSHRLYNDIREHGGNAIMWKTGHSLIKAQMKATGALLAGEMSGHIFFADRYFGFDDAIYAAARILEIASEYDGIFSGLLTGLPKVFATPEIRVDCPDAIKFKCVEIAADLLAKDHKVNRMDGVRLDFKDGWGLLRASNTQPVLVLRFEAESEAKLSELRALFQGVLNQASKVLGHGEIRF